MEKEKKIPLLVICGPTASGKTALAIKAAQELTGEIVNADSMQIYKYMDIGTAKPTAFELSQAVHHLVGFVDPKDNFSVADYTPLAHTRLKEIYDNNRYPILSGGTGLYINSVVNDVTFGEEDSDDTVRKELNEIAKEQGNEVLVEMLKKIDPVSAERLHPNNLRRIIRAIEFYKKTGKPISVHQEETKQIESRYVPQMFMLDFERDELYERINKRVNIMIEGGLINEVEELLNMGCTSDMQSMQGIGYKETAEYLNGRISLDECISAIQQNSRHYAKRQLTWFRRDKRITLVKPNETDYFLEQIKSCL